MADFSILWRQHAKDWGSAQAGKRLSSSDGSLAKKLGEFLDAHGFTNLEPCDKGSTSIILKDVENPSLILRLAPIHERDKRLVIPQVLQPIHVETITDGVRDLKIEFLRNINANHIEDDQVGGLLPEFKKEVEASGYHFESDDPQWDSGVFVYEDSSGKQKMVMMAADAGLIEAPQDQPPTCTADYPTLEIQWREQCKMVEADPRLKKLVGGLPAKLPMTRVIPSVAIGEGRWS